MVITHETYKESRSLTDNYHDEFSRHRIYPFFGWREDETDDRFGGVNKDYLDINKAIDYHAKDMYNNDVLIQERYRRLSDCRNYNDITIRYRRDGNKYDDRVNSEIYKLMNTIDEFSAQRFYLMYCAVADDVNKIAKFAVIDLHALVNEFQRGNIMVPALGTPDSKRSYILSDGRMVAGINGNRDFSSTFLSLDVGQLAAYFPDTVHYEHGFQQVICNGKPVVPRTYSGQLEAMSALYQRSGSPYLAPVYQYMQTIDHNASDRLLLSKRRELELQRVDVEAAPIVTITVEEPHAVIYQTAAAPKRDPQMTR